MSSFLLHSGYLCLTNSHMGMWFLSLRTLWVNIIQVGLYQITCEVVPLYLGKWSQPGSLILIHTHMLAMVRRLKKSDTRLQK